MWKAVLGGPTTGFLDSGGGGGHPCRGTALWVGAAFPEVMRKEAGLRCPSAGTGARGTGDGAGLRC